MNRETEDLIIIALLGLMFVLGFVGNAITQPTQQQNCSLPLMLCPNGSIVMRVEPVANMTSVVFFDRNGTELPWFRLEDGLMIVCVRP